MPGAGDTQAPVTLVNHPVLYDGEAAEVRLAPQPLGAQTEEVLTEIGLSRRRDRALAERQRVTIQAGPACIDDHRWRAASCTFRSRGVDPLDWRGRMTEDWSAMQ